MTCLHEDKSECSILNPSDIFSALAFAKYSEAIALAPKNAMLYSNRAATLIKMGKLDSAKTDATR